LKSLYYQEMIRLHDEAERLNSSAQLHKEAYLNRKEEMVAVYEQKALALENAHPHHSIPEDYPLNKAYDPSHLAKCRERRRVRAEGQEAERARQMTSLSEKRRNMIISRIQLERHAGIYQKSDFPFRQDKELAPLVVRIATESVPLVTHIVDKCRLLQSKLVELSSNLAWPSLDDDEQNALMEAAMEAATDSKALVTRSKPLENIKESLCRTFVLSCIELVGVVTQYIRVLSVVLFKGGQTQPLVDECNKSYAMVQNLLRNALSSSKQLIERYEQTEEKEAGGGDAPASPRRGARATLRIRNDKEDYVETGKDLGPLEKLFFRKDFPLALALVKAVDLSDFDKYSCSMVDLFASHNLIIPLIARLINAEVHHPTTSSGSSFFFSLFFSSP
jgi:hypothetical protein